MKTEMNTVKVRKTEELFATMSSDEFKKSKKITPLHREKGMVNFIINFSEQF